MENHGLGQVQKPGCSGSVVPYIIITLLILVIIILLFVFFLSPDSLRNSMDSSPQPSPGITDSSKPSGDGSSQSPGSIELSQTEPSDLAGSAQDPDKSVLNQTGETGVDRNDPKDLGDSSCGGLADNVESFFNTLDTREYIKEFQLDSPSAVYFPKLIQRLVDNPPIVSSKPTTYLPFSRTPPIFFA